jgi:hypothetical protein
MKNEEKGDEAVHFAHWSSGTRERGLPHTRYVCAIIRTVRKVKTFRLRSLQRLPSLLRICPEAKALPSGSFRHLPAH